MIRIVLGATALATLAGCITLAGYSGVIYVPQGSVQLPREDTLEACAASVRAAAKADNPAGLGTFLPSQLTAPRQMGEVLGLCGGPDGAMHLILEHEIREGPRVLRER